MQVVRPTEAFSRDVIYTLTHGPNAGRPLKYLGPGVHPFEDMVHIGTADGLPWGTKNGSTENTGICRPEHLVPKV